MTIQFRVDLHTHTNCSDGSLTPEQLLHEAKKVGLSGLSITDHDCIDAYTEKTIALSKELGLLLLPGMEISSRHRQHDVHILGYGFDLHSKSLSSFLEVIQKRREERNAQILQKLCSRKMPISIEELDRFAKQGMSKKVIGRPHIAYLMIEKGYVGSMQEAFNFYLKDNGLCYVPGVKFNPIEIIGAIHLAGGKAILAHPHFINSQRTVRELLEMPFDGIECYYAKLPSDQEKKWLEIAEQKNWIATGGSDFHGDAKPYIPLGCSWVGEETYSRLVS